MLRAILIGVLLLSVSFAFLCQSEKTKTTEWYEVQKLEKKFEIEANENKVVIFNKSYEIEFIESKKELSQNEVNAIEVSPNWLKDNLTRKFRELDTFGEAYANLILNLNNSKYIDEVAFSIVALSKEVLQRIKPKVLEDNAYYIYEIDKELKYANIVEKEYTTLEYFVNESFIIKKYELPKEIYYWYVVHPKISDEDPTYIDPDTGKPADPPKGRFWREYLFYNNDSSYPPDPEYGSVKYPKDISPPLLREVLKNVTTLWNSTSYTAPSGYGDDGYNNNRSFDYGDHAIEKLSNWVMKTLPLNNQESNDSERPIQPVRIAKHHNGNCGELQDLSTAGARAALIPTKTVLNLGEDHVWQEFYDRRWVHWDNWWSDGGTAVDKPNIYEEGWGKKLSGIGDWHGNDFVSSNQKYSKNSIIEVKVLDANDEPVDGASVVIYTRSYYDPNMLTVSIWNTTNASGIAKFYVGDEKDYWTGAESEHLGGDATKNYVFVTSNSKANTTYYATIRLQNAKEKILKKILKASEPKEKIQRYRLDINFRTEYAGTKGYNWLLKFVGFYSHYYMQSDAKINFFILNSTNYYNYTNGKNFYAFEYREAYDGKVSFELPTDENWYIVFSNQNLISTYQLINITISLFVKPYAYIEKPEKDGLLFSSGEYIIIEGYADAFFLSKLEISINNGTDWQDISSLYNKTTKKWYYNWNTSSMDGIYEIRIRITDGNNKKFIDGYRKIIIDGLEPEITMELPNIVSQGSIINITGTAYDNISVKKVEIMFDFGDWLNITSNYNKITFEWYYIFDTALLDGKYKVTARALDLVGKEKRIEKEIFIDAYDPTVKITSLKEMYSGNETYEIKGFATDNYGIKNLEIEIDGERYNIGNYDNSTGKWFWNFSTESYLNGEYIVIIYATDLSGRSGKDLQKIFIDTLAPILEIIEPKEHLAEIGKKIEFLGNGIDNFEIEKIEVGIFGQYFDITENYTENEFHFIFDTSGFLPGDYEIILSAMDSVGNIGNYSFFIKLFDKTKPEITVNAENEVDIGNKTKLFGKAWDNVGIEKIEISFGEAWINITDYKNGSWYYIWDTGKFKPGYYTISIRATDSSNNSKVIMKKILLIDNEKPKLELSTKNFFSYGEKIIIIGNIEENVGIKKIELIFDSDVKDITDSYSNGSFSYEIKELSSGRHRLIFRIIDEGNNIVEKELFITVGEKKLDIITYILMGIGIFGIAFIITILLIRRKNIGRWG
ncbi:MAG: transglutaminase-like domain-containing protein [Candidatus Thermoplasmatota archaeon]